MVKCQCDSCCSCCEDPAEFQGMKPTRDNVRVLIRGFKIRKANLEDDLDLLEEVYQAYAEKAGKSDLQKEFKTLRESLKKLATAFSAERL